MPDKHLDESTITVVEYNVANRVIFKILSNM
jgi:hypothetical protein